MLLEPPQKFAGVCFGAHFRERFCVHLEAGGFKSAGFAMHTKMEPFLGRFWGLLGAFWDPWGHLWETFGELLQLWG